MSEINLDDDDDIQSSTVQRHDMTWHDMTMSLHDIVLRCHVTAVWRQAVFAFHALCYQRLYVYRA